MKLALELSCCFSLCTVLAPFDVLEGTHNTASLLAVQISGYLGRQHQVVLQLHEAPFEAEQLLHVLLLRHRSQSSLPPCWWRSSGVQVPARESVVVVSACLLTSDPLEWPLSDSSVH